MEWLGSNWIWLALGVAAFAFFAFRRGGCGTGHGTHGDRRREGSDESTTPPANQGALTAAHAGHDSGLSQAGRQQHRHGC
jgi:hypothetical protein